MTQQELDDLYKSHDCPDDVYEAMLFVHNKLIDEIMYELWDFREQKALSIKSSYVSCNHIMQLPSLQKI